jgi:hypothetical protein
MSDELNRPIGPENKIVFKPFVPTEEQKEAYKYGKKCYFLALWLVQRTSF